MASFVVACGNDHGAPNPGQADAGSGSGGNVDASGMPDGNPLEPPTLFGTGLCVDQACTQIGSGILQYEPQYVLFADGASKQRWISIPPGTTIDTSDPDHWVFPVGTKVWKEFDSEGVRVETRYIVKIDDSEALTPDPWFYVSYQWNSMKGGDEQGTDTMAVTAGVDDANGTSHKIPSRSECKGCHENLLPGRVLGFGALSLDFHQTTAGLLDLDGAIAAGLLSDPPAGSASPHYPLPSDATDADKAALGYMHANCGHCHNDSSPIFAGQTPINLRMDIAKLDHFANTTLATSTIGRSGMVQTHVDGDLDGTPPNCAAFADISGQPGCTQIVVPDWATLTAYKAGDRIVNGGNAYICITAGTSGAVGPTGQGTGVVDGTATWDYAGTPLSRSILIYRFETNDVAKNMPAGGANHTIDGSGDTILTTWVDQLP
nr:hypothetical protein [Kofleriaceae bacterium]